MWGGIATREGSGIVRGSALGSALSSLGTLNPLLYHISSLCQGGIGRYVAAGTERSEHPSIRLNAPRRFTPKCPCPKVAGPAPPGARSADRRVCGLRDFTDKGFLRAPFPRKTNSSRPQKPPINEAGESRGHCEGGQGRETGCPARALDLPLVICRCLLRGG